jgi:hypothetical protein
VLWLCFLFVLLWELLCLLVFPVFGMMTGRDHMAEGHTLGYFGHAVTDSSLQCRFLCLVREYWGGRVGLRAAMCLGRFDDAS